MEYIELKKRFRVSVISLLLLPWSVKKSSADTWTWQNPLPQGNYLDALDFPTPDTGYAVGNAGAILRTADGGRTWSTVFQNDWCDFLSIHFSGTKYGIAVGTGSDPYNHVSVPSVYGTRDGGLHWSLVETGPVQSFHTVKMLSPDSAFIASGSNGLLRTTDGGITWKPSNLPVDTESSVDNIGISFSSPRIGFVLTNTHLFRTLSGGDAWERSSLPDGFTKLSVLALSENEVIIGGSKKDPLDARFNACIFKSRDGGKTWTESSIPSGTGGKVNSLESTNGQVMYATGRQGLLLRSHDQGASWEMIRAWVESDPNLATNFASAEVGYACGFGGLIEKTTDGGLSWTELSEGHGRFHEFSAIQFPSPKVGFAVGYDSDRKSSILLRTLDAGAGWDSIPIPKAEFHCLHFLDPMLGFMAGRGGAVLKTQDGGANWNSVGTPTGGNWSDVRMLDSENVMVLGDSGIERSSDAGAHWSRAWQEPHVLLNSVESLNRTEAFAFGRINGAGEDTGIIVCTRDGGITWDRKNIGLSEISSVSFPSEKMGYAGTTDGAVYKTSDGGDTWALVATRLPTAIIAIHFFDADTGYCAARQGVFRTVDAGLHWEYENIGASTSISAMAFPDRNSAFAVGEWGTILKLSRLPVSSMISAKKATRKVEARYVDGKILFSLDGPSVVHASLYDMRGTLLFTVANSFYPSGEHEITLSSRPRSSGRVLVDFRLSQAH